jgi:hypothetical protein
MTMTDNARTSLHALAGELENETCDLTAAVGLLLDGLHSDHDLDTFAPAVSRLYLTASALCGAAKQLHSVSAKTCTTATA